MESRAEACELGGERYVARSNSQAMIGLTDIARLLPRNLMSPARHLNLSSRYLETKRSSSTNIQAHDHRILPLVRRFLRRHELGRAFPNRGWRPTKQRKATDDGGDCDEAGKEEEVKRPDCHRRACLSVTSKV